MQRGRSLGQVAHRLGGVGEQVQHDLLQRVPVTDHLGQVLRELDLRLDVPQPEVVAHQQQRALHQVVQVQPRTLGRSLAGEGEQVADDAPRALRLLVDHPQVATVARSQLLLLEQELRQPRDRREGIVELVRDAGHELPDGGELLALDQLGFHRLLLGDVLDQHDRRLRPAWRRA